VLDHPGLERDTRMPFGTITLFILSTPIDNIYSKKAKRAAPTVCAEALGRDIFTGLEARSAAARALASADDGPLSGSAAKVAYYAADVA
jgi:hypothetical protein